MNSTSYLRVESKILLVEFFNSSEKIVQRSGSTVLVEAIFSVEDRDHSQTCSSNIALTAQSNAQRKQQHMELVDRPVDRL